MSKQHPGLPPVHQEGQVLVSIAIHIHVLSLPLMWPTAACMVALCWALGGGDARTVADASLAFYVITTLPHHLLGLRLPRPDMRPAASGPARAASRP